MTDKITKFSMTLSAGILAAVLSSLAWSQETLVDLVKSGNREAVLAAITSPDLDVDVPEADGSTALHWATYQVDRGLVKALLERGAKADVTNRFGSTPLAEAVKLGDAELVRMLLEAGANPDSPNQDNQTALMLAASVGSLEIAGMLIDAGATVNAVETFRDQTALMWAAAENHPEIVEFLVARGADVSLRAKYDDWERQMTAEPRAQYRDTGGLTALLYAARSGCYRCVVAIVGAGADINKPNPDGTTPLITALDNKNFDIAMYLLDQGANAEAWDMHGRTPLYVAVDMNTFNLRGFSNGFGFNRVDARAPDRTTAMQVVNRLLDMGVDPNHQLTRIRPNGNGRDRFVDYMLRGGTGPLMVATLSHDHEAMQALLAHGAEVDLPNVFQITPLMAAAGVNGSARGSTTLPKVDDLQGHIIRTLDILLDAGADINARVTDSHTHTAELVAYVKGRDHEGQTALFGAAELGFDRVVEHLLERGADPAIRDAAGNSALDYALAPVGAGTSAVGGPLMDEEGRQRLIPILQALIPEAPATTGQTGN